MIKEFLKNNEDNIVSIITIAIIIITLIIVVVIWIFNFSGTSNNENLNYYDKKIYSNEMLSEYENEIVNLLNINRVEELYKKADLKFLSDNGLDEDNFKTYLLSNNLIGNSITIVSSECIEYENVYIFRYYYKNYSDYKYVNLIETAPDEYTISFEQEKVSSDIYSKSYFGNNNGVEAEISIVESGNDFIKFSIKIINNNSLDAYIDFNDINTFSLIGNNINIPVAGVVASNISYLTTNSQVNKELYFSISNEEKNKCYGIKINNVKINNEYFDVVIKYREENVL